MSRSRPSESTDGHIFHTWLSHQFHPPSPSPSSDFPAVAARDETLFCPICRAWHDLTGRWGVDWYQSPGRQTGDGGGLEENWDVDLGSIYSPLLPPSLPPFPASTSRIWITVAATAVHTWSELGLNMSGGSL